MSDENKTYELSIHDSNDHAIELHEEFILTNIWSMTSFAHLNHQQTLQFCSYERRTIVFVCVWTTEILIRWLSRIAIHYYLSKKAWIDSVESNASQIWISLLFIIACVSSKATNERQFFVHVMITSNIRFCSSNWQMHSHSFKTWSIEYWLNVWTSMW